MNPLFENRLKLDKEALLEWYRWEFLGRRGLFLAVHVALIAMYVVAAVTFGVMAVSLRWGTMWAMCAVFAGIALLFLLHLFLRPHLQVWLAMRKDKQGVYGNHYITLVYEDRLLPMLQEGEAATVKSRLAAYLSGAGSLQREFEEILRNMGDTNAEDMEQLGLLRQKLEQLQKRMKEMEAVAQWLEKTSGNMFNKLVGCAKTQNLYILTFEEQTILLARGGFGNEDGDGEFSCFMRETLQKTAAAAPDEKSKKRLAADAALL